MPHLHSGRRLEAQSSRLDAHSQRRKCHPAKTAVVRVFRAGHPERHALRPGHARTDPIAPDRIRIAGADPACAAAQDCLQSYFAELARRFENGFDPGPLTDAGLAAFRPPAGCFLIAACDGLPVGCVGLAGDGGTIAEVKRLWIAPAARGLGLATRLMDAVEARARALGVTRLRLDTNRALTNAIAMYRTMGWTAIPAYNDNPYAHHWFEKPVAAAP
jgi:GNAT superfamily N-acetyltransferase